MPASNRYWHIYIVRLRDFLIIIVSMYGEGIGTLLNIGKKTNYHVSGGGEIFYNI